MFVDSSRVNNLKLRSHDVASIDHPNQNSHGVHPHLRSANISDSHGSVLHDPSVYLIYYGDTPEEKKTIIDTFVQNLGRSDWWKVNSIYGDSRGFVPASLKYKGSTVVIPASNKPTVLDTSRDLSAVSSIVQEAFNAGLVAPDTHGNTRK